jgi:NAD-dependent deacetylase
MARAWLADAGSIAVLTGAGISAESGVPTFRGPGGLWRNHKPERLATPEAFRQDPALVWQWYDHRRQNLAQVEPNAGHHALVDLQRRSPSFTLITQNVDGLHERAGSAGVLKLHGDIWTLRCTGCGRSHTELAAPLPNIPPLCECGAVERPGVVWFGESLPQEMWRRAQAAARNCDVFLVSGTSAQVYPAASLIDEAQSNGARVIEVNLDATAYSESAHLSLRGKSGEILPQLL